MMVMESSNPVLKHTLESTLFLNDLDTKYKNVKVYFRMCLIFML